MLRVNLFSSRRRQCRGAIGAETDLEHRVPVATGATHAKLAFDQRVREARAANPIRVDDVRFAAFRVDTLRAGNCGSQRLNRLRVRWVLETDDEQVAGIALRFFAKRICGNDRLPFFGCTDEKVCLQIESLPGFLFQETFEGRAGARLTSKNQIAALEDRLCVGKAQVREEVTQIRHSNLLVTADIDAPKEGDVRLHGLCTVSTTEVTEVTEAALC
jgi:hypothetical protein